ncbi:MAG TPA: translation initiation factor IF-2 [Thermodesulfobacteriota bacterium]|nr:translation initiation factor IF-2 [Thermodesulfobacteriota bacterium]
MAKIRVYELAKELQMENKVLVDLAREMGIDIKSHSSSISDEEVSLIKGHLRGTKSLVVEEQRVKSTVIRRRKKIVEVEQETVEEPVEKEIPEVLTPPGIPPAPETPGELRPETVAEEKPEEEVPEIAREKEGEKEIAPQPVREEKEIQPVRPLRAVREKEAPAKVIRRPEPPARVIRPAEPVSKPVPAPTKPSVTPTKSEPAKFGRVERTPEKVEKESEKDKPILKKKPKLTREQVEVELAKAKVFKKKREVLERADLYDDASKEARAFKAGKGGKLPAKKFKKTEITTPKAIKRRLKIAETINVGELAKRMGIKSGDLIKKMIALGLMATINQSIEFDSATLVAAEFGFEVEKSSFEEEQLLHLHADLPEELQERPPVVTIMGHVDHGKTSLLDTIRKTNVTAGEAGGITQHIGAYHVHLDRGEIVFLDTPGHEAFTAMRARGAQITDIVILVVAADDGMMQQTREAIDHARAAGVPIIVAINKIDKPGANPDRVKRQLADYGLVPEDWGGDTIYAEVSAKTGTGVDNLLELILLQAEVLELKANPNKLAMGRIVEARLDKGRGPVATVLIQGGILKTGDPFICGIHFGKVRALFNDWGQKVEQALPSTPVEVHGFSGVPMAGDEFIVCEDEKTAKQIGLTRLQKKREAELSRTSKVSLEKLYEQIKEGQVKELNVILKADVQGSIEAINEALHKLSTAAIKVNVLHSSPGAITETDIMLASASKAIIIGFNVRLNHKVQELAEQEQVDVRFYDVIYQLVSEVKDAMVGLLEPVHKEVVLGHAEVREIFHVPKVGAIAGSLVTDGKIERSARARLLRDQVVVFDGRLGSLRRIKDDVREVVAGYECGIRLEGYNDLKLGDIIEAYMVEEVKPEL